MMDFEEFKGYIASHIREHLPEGYADAEIKIQDVQKTNDTLLSGLCIRQAHSNIAPNVYLEPFYEDYTRGTGVEDILKHIASVQIKHEPASQFDLSAIMDYEKAKDHIICRLVNADMSRDYLSDKPHKRIEDLAVTYAVDLGTNAGGRMSSPVTKALLESYGVSAEELHEAAVKNLSKAPTYFKSMNEVIAEMMGIPAEALPPMDPTAPPMYILSNKDKISGAVKMLDIEAMDKIAKELGGDFVILPSSIHEVIILPMSNAFDTEQLEALVQEVNAGQVAPEERLSNRVYAYDSERQRVLLAEKYMGEKEHGPEKVVIPEGTVEIEERAFEGHSELKEVVFPESLEQIGDRAFASTGLTSISIPDNAKYIGKDAFLHCEGLKRVSVGSETLVSRDAFPDHCEIERRGEQEQSHSTDLEGPSRR